MKRQITVLLALVASVGVGVATGHAQTKPKAYTIAEVEILERRHNRLAIDTRVSGRAASGHTAAQPSPAMNFRRRIGHPLN